jgi:metal-sulfur cluster biosynthetic enzyme
MNERPAAPPALVDRAAVTTALGRVIDPCSVATGVPASIVDMGLVQSVDSDNGEIEITLRLTSPICNQVVGIVTAIEREVGSVPGVSSVQCEVDHAAEWWPHMVADSVQQRLRELRPLALSPEVQRAQPEPSEVRGPRRRPRRNS